MTCWTWPEIWRTTLWLRRTSSNRTTRWLDGPKLPVLTTSGLLNVSVCFHQRCLFDLRFLLFSHVSSCCLSYICPLVGSIRQKKTFAGVLCHSSLYILCCVFLFLADSEPVDASGRPELWEAEDRVGATGAAHQEVGQLAAVADAHPSLLHLHQHDPLHPNLPPTPMMTSLCSPELLVRHPPVLQGSYYTGIVDPRTVSVQVIQMSSGQNQKKKTNSVRWEETFALLKLNV